MENYAHLFEHLAIIVGMIESELIVSIAAQFGTKVIFIYQKEEIFEATLAKDVLEVITVFSAKLYGSRSHKNKKTISLAAQN